MLKAFLAPIGKQIVQPIIHRALTVAATALVAYGIPTETVDAFVASVAAILMVATEIFIRKG